MIQESTNIFNSDERDNARSQELNAVMSTESFQTSYVDGLRTEPNTNPEAFFNSIHTMFFYEPEEFSKWQARPENRDMAVRFHAMAATSEFNTNGHNWTTEAGDEWNNEKHQQYANVLADQLRKDAGWGEEYERDGSMFAANYGGEYSKDVNNAFSGGDFWKIGTSQKKSDGIGNYIEENPAQVALIVASLAFAPYATQAIGTALTGTIPAAAIPAVSGGIYAAGSQLAGQVVTGQDIDLAGALETGVISAATFGIVQTGAGYLTEAAGISQELAEKAMSIGLETAANGGDLVAAVTDELISSGMELAGNALDGLTGAIGDFVTGDPEVQYEDETGALVPRPDDPNADNGLLGTGIGGLEDPTQTVGQGDLEFIDTSEIQDLYKIPKPPVGLGPVDSYQESVSGTAVPTLTADQQYDYNQELDSFFEANPSVPDMRYDTAGAPVPRIEWGTDANGNRVQVMVDPFTNETLHYDSGETHNGSIAADGEFNGSESWASGEHNWQDYEGPVFANGSGPVDPNHPYWQSQVSAPVTSIPTGDGDGGGGGGGGGSSSAMPEGAIPNGEMVAEDLGVVDAEINHGTRPDADATWYGESADGTAIAGNEWGEAWERPYQPADVTPEFTPQYGELLPDFNDPSNSYDPNDITGNGLEAGVIDEGLTDTGGLGGGDGVGDGLGTDGSGDGSNGNGNGSNGNGNGSNGTGNGEDGNGSGSGGNGGGLGSGSVLIGNGTQASAAGNLFDYTRISPAAYAILAPLIDAMEGLK